MAYSSIGRRRAAVSVYVNIYDLSPANEWCLHSMGLGLYHSGVVVLGNEYTFASGAGIFPHTPQDTGAAHAKFRGQILIGTFEGGPMEVQSAIRSLESRFGPDEYNILQNNCNTFANALCLKLCNVPIPDYINRIANYSVFCKCLIPREILKGRSPVNQIEEEQRQESIAFLVPRKHHGAVGDGSEAVTAFTGTGSKLGGTTSSSHDATVMALTDRRDKARLAALARLELHQQQQQQQQQANKDRNDDKSS